MRTNPLKYGTAALALVGAFAFGSTDAQSEIMRADTGSPGNVSHTVTVVLSKIWNRELGNTTQINDSQTLTRSAIKLGRGQLEMMPFPTTIYTFLSKGSRMYKKKQHEQAIAASKNVRSIWGWNAVLFHPVTFVKSGIKTYGDLKGKRVFTGPPSGAAAVTSESVIRAVTGYIPNKDYKAIRLPWGSGLQAMLDGKLDVYFRPAGVGSAAVEQLGLKQKFRLLDIGDATTSAAWKKYLKPMGREQGIIPAGTYKGQINNDKDVVVGANTFQYAVNKSLPDDLVYRMTKLTWDNIGEIHKTAVTLQTMDKSKPFTGVNMPLHRGAIRYYKEKGIKIPAGLIPPEAM
ncbi:MAG: TAXI family TRAP transporter solute-binding subunit [Rhodospirillales bacterium]|nr:TAXI family TRAP transporter solute-binding subunit [Rhodospirillales bacterium]